MTKPNKKNRMMKKLFTLFACAVTLFTACTKDDGGTRVRTYEIAVRLIYPDYRAGLAALLEAEDTPA